MKLSETFARGRSTAQRGFTFVEVMIASGLGSMVLAAVVSVMMYSARTSAAIVNYTDLDSKSRYALDAISREVRGATAVLSLQTNNQSVVTLNLTNATVGSTASLAYDPNAQTVVLSRTGQLDLTALRGCDTWSIALYQRTPIVTATNVLYYPATNSTGALDLNLCKLVSLSWKCSRTILNQKVNTESVQAAQIVLRNKR
jgi:prepilin-type N-terminal cleavage/methylation domain-containing protein